MCEFAYLSEINKSAEAMFNSLLIRIDGQYISRSNKLGKLLIVIIRDVRVRRQMVSLISQIKLD